MPSLRRPKDAGFGVRIHAFKSPNLSGGTLVVSLPNLGLGSVLFTDYLLAQESMDHVASADSPAFPAVAMVHDGKPRFPIRIHADPATKLAVLRSEVPASGFLLRELAAQVIDWAQEMRLERIVCLDGLGTRDDHADMFYACSRPKDEALLQAKGVHRLDNGVLGGFTACLLLESRLQDFEVVALMAALRDPETDVRSCLRFADIMPAFVPGLKVDRAALERELGPLEKTIRRLHEQAQKALRSLEGEAPTAQDYV